MTYLDKKQFLKRYRLLIAEAKRLAEHINALRDIAEKITPTLSGMPSANGTSRKVESAAISLADYENELNEKMLEIKSALDQIERAINTIPDPVRQSVVRLRYIYCTEWADIAYDLHYTLRRVFQLHTMALNEMRVDDEI